MIKEGKKFNLPEDIEDKDVNKEANKIASHLLRKKSYFDIPDVALPPDIRDLIEKGREGKKNLKDAESRKLQSWLGKHEQEFTFGEREPIGLGKYPEEVKDLVRKSRRENLTPQEQSHLHKLLADFLGGRNAESGVEETFYHDFLSAKELENNFSQNESLAVVADFYREILKKDRWDKSSLDALKGYLIDKHPDSVEEIQVVVGMVQHLYLQEEVEKEKEAETLTFKYDPERSRNFAEYNYLFSHFFVNLPPDRVYGQSLYTALFLVAEKLGFQHRLFGSIWQGNMGQVAIYKALSGIGQKPEFSTPKEDVYQKIDLWAAKSGEEAASFQIKTARSQRQTLVLKESEWIDFPSVAERLSKSERHYIYSKFGEMNNYSAKVKKYGQEIGRDVRAYYVVIPPNSIDFFTGELAPTAVKKLQEKVAAQKREESQNHKN